LIPAIGLSLLAAPIAIAGLGWHGGWHGHSGDLTEDQVRSRVTFATDRAFTRIDATDDQRDEISGLIDEALPEMMQYRSQGKDLRQQFRSAMQEDELDARRLEALRQSGISLIDQASRRGLDMMVEVSSVLTPEQRAQLREGWQERRAAWGGGHH